MKISLSATVSLLLAASASAADVAPSLREGLWSIHTQTTENPGNKQREGNQSICRSHAYDDYMRALPKKVQCKTLSDTSSGGVKVTETECTVAGSVLKTKATVTISGDTAAHSEVHTTQTPALYGVSETTMVMDQKYVGACAAGMQPGDIMGADGKIMTRWKH